MNRETMVVCDECRQWVDENTATERTYRGRSGLELRTVTCGDCQLKKTVRAATSGGETR